MTTQTETRITKAEVETAWELQSQAADWYERCTLFRGSDGITQKVIDDACEAMLEATDYAERLQALYDEQYEQWVTS